MKDEFILYPASLFGKIYESNKIGAIEALDIQCKIIANELIDLGININTSPVLDIPVCDESGVTSDESGDTTSVQQTQQAANVLLQIEKVTAEKSGNSLNAKKEKELKESIQSNYDEKTEILHAASQLWVDAVIKPEETRSWISMGIDIANQAPSEEKFNMGLLQV